MATRETKPFTKGVLNNSDQSTFKDKTILLKYIRKNRKKYWNFIHNGTKGKIEKLYDY